MSIQSKTKTGERLASLAAGLRVVVVAAGWAVGAKVGGELLGGGAVGGAVSGAVGEAVGGAPVRGIGGWYNSRAGLGCTQRKGDN